MSGSEHVDLALSLAHVVNAPTLVGVAMIISA
jgi:hypothetical protein